MRSRTLAEYAPRQSSPLPNAPFLKGGGTARAVTGDCRIRMRPAKHAGGIAQAGKAGFLYLMPTGSPLRSSGRLAAYPPCPLSCAERGIWWEGGCAPSPQTGKTAAGEAPMIVNSLSRLAAAAPLPKEPFGLCALERWPNTNPRQSSPLPNAPFLKGGGSAQALPGDCRIRMRPAKHAGGIAQAGKAGFLYLMPTGSPLRSSGRLAAYPPYPLSCAERGIWWEGAAPLRRRRVKRRQAKLP